MALVQRPAKQGGTTTYQGKVAQGFTKILSAEMDADLDTIYAAWNTGADTVNIADGAVTTPKLAPGVLLWQVSGTALTPVDATKLVTLAAPSVTAKSRLYTGSSGSTYLLNNFTTQPALAADDASLAGWWAQIGGSGYDGYYLWRTPAGSTVPRLAWSVDATSVVTHQSIGAATFVRYSMIPGATTASCSLNAYMSGTSPMLDLTTNYNQAVAAKAVWQLTLDTNFDRVVFLRQPPSTGGFLTPFQLDANANLTLSGPTVGSTGNLTINGNTATKNSGTTWANPSDIRLKQDVGRYGAGLAEIRQLEPITYRLREAPGELCYGFDAAAVRRVLPECVSTVAMQGMEDVLLLNMHPILVALVNAVKELAERA